MKRVVTIQDISCIGKCSLTVALPLLSAMGLETAVIPTAVLSTHTAFSGFTFRDLTAEIAPVAAHWRSLGMTFDAVYSGYLGSEEQVELVCGFLDEFRKPGSCALVDPAMADFGRLYAGFTPSFVQVMKRLCAKADVILPNLTEACLLLDVPYEPEPDEARVKELLRGLSGLGCGCVVLTGVSFEEGKLGAVGYNASEDRFYGHFREKLPESFHGTGDIFASVFTGATVRGFAPEKALELAVDFTQESIRKTMADPDHRWYGVNFEEAIPLLVDRIRESEGERK